MKFKSLTLFNFMRYKGKNTLEFSCSDDKNVTVVLGNNTFGKTTLAQAFRWGLFEELNTTNYTKKNNIILLNHDVISTMNITTEQSVWVEIVMEEGPLQWHFRREARFKRKYPGTTNLEVSQVGESKLTMVIYENGVPGEVINNNGLNSGKNNKAGCVQDTINNMLPPQLANYFFFDGERWADPKTAKNDVKDSINTILGITGLLELKKHLKDGQGATVIRSLRGRIQGSGQEYDRVMAKIRSLDTEIENCEQTIKTAKESLETARNNKDRLETELNSNRQTEQDQQKFQQLTQSIGLWEKNRENYYADIVRLFSSSARFLAASLSAEVQDLLSKVELEGKDIPGVTTDTIDYLVELGVCLCGQPLTEGSPAYESLMKLRRVIPPEMIGGAANKFQDLLNGWGADNKELPLQIQEKAEDFEAANDEVGNLSDERNDLGRKMDRKTSVAMIRRNYESAKQMCRTLEDQRNTAVAKRDFAIKERENQYDQLKIIAQQDKANEQVNRAIAYAEEIYNFADKQTKKKQAGIFEELNSIIAENFERMFKDGEKYARLEDDYRIHVYYHDVGGQKGHEETNLSNGEATAINFVYIVSILELARRRSNAATDGETLANNGIINLPLVLDGPFSSLSNENTNLVAQKLPEFAEQVIIFMLDKDWEASGLDEYTLPGYCFHINKEEKSNSSSFEMGGVD